MNPPPLDNDPIITQFNPVEGQWELNDDNINRIDPQTGETILHNYCKHINSTPVEVFKLLVETKHCDINALNDNHNTPLHIAFSSFYFDHGASADVLTYLLHQDNVNVNIKDQYDRNLIDLAYFQSRQLPIDAFKYLVEIKGIDLNEVDSDNNTLLHRVLIKLTLCSSDVDILGYLLRQDGIDAKIKNKDDLTILHLVCKNINLFQLDILKYLIETKHADINALDKENKTPINHAIMEFDPKKRGDITALTYLLKQDGFDVNIKDKYGCTSLDWACFRINRLPLDIFKVLIEIKGADINGLEGNNNTLYRTFTNFFDGDPNILTYLLDQDGVNVNIKGYHGRTVLHLACTRINYLPLFVFKCLIESKRADVNVQDDKKNTPLHHLLREFKPTLDNTPIILAYLLEQNGIDVNIQDRFGLTALHLICQNVNAFPIDIFESLIEINGGNMSIQDNQGRTPLHYAVFSSKFEHDDPVLRYLLGQKDLDLTILDQNGRNLLHQACIAPKLESKTPQRHDLPREDDTVRSEMIEFIAERVCSCFPSQI
jgi:ankyrin repeat protein